MGRGRPPPPGEEEDAARTHSATSAAPQAAAMDVMTHTHQDLHKQLSCFVSLEQDDELAQLILEELAMPRRSYAGVIASMATSPSNKSDLGLNTISEEDQATEE